MGTLLYQIVPLKATACPVKRKPRTSIYRGAGLGIAEVRNRVIFAYRGEPRRLQFV